MKLKEIEPASVFKYFEELSGIPRGSGYMDKISSYCLEFADKNKLKAIRDEHNNVVIYKNGTEGYEGSEPVILQGHLDMVWQKTEDCNIDFYNDGLDLYVEGDYLKAKGTTLGADNGIAVAMIFAILASDNLIHPPIEAVLTTDEETGMFGALGFSPELVKGKRMINIDSEDPSKVTVSCAGGFEFRTEVKVCREKYRGRRISISFSGLMGGHSGADINKLRVNADVLMGRVLDSAVNKAACRLISINGGDKGNVIPNSCVMELAFNGGNTEILENLLSEIKTEILDREEGFAYDISISELTEELSVIDRMATDKIVMLLYSAPNGIISMSATIAGLVESSSNLGVVKTSNDSVCFVYTLRSNKKTALSFLEDKMKRIAASLELDFEACGHYPPWEYNPSSVMEKIYIECCEKKLGVTPEVCAIHAGLECGVFAGKISGFDCISVGPVMHDIHTVKERLSIKSTEEFYCILKDILEKLCKG